MPNFSGIWTVTQQMQAKGQSLWPEAPPSIIGEAYGGGFYAGSISTAANSIADYYLIVGPKASAESFLQWKPSGPTNTAGTNSVIDGPANSAAMNNASHPAAQFCEGLTIGGFSDWYMPAKNELEVCYYNLKPTTLSNSTSSGINANAVPARASNYTTGTPSQTSAADFQSGGTEAYQSVVPGVYWSSTQFDTNYSALQYFRSPSGYQNNRTKTYDQKVRAIRRVAV